jgi:hypothetical protein
MSGRSSKHKALKELGITPMSRSQFSDAMGTVTKDLLGAVTADAPVDKEEFEKMRSQRAVIAKQVQSLGFEIGGFQA